MSEALELTVAVPPIEVPAAFLFAHPTRMADAFGPRPERITRPAMTVPAREMQVRVFEGSTAALGIRVPTRNPLRRLRRLGTLKMPGRYVFDARYNTDHNVAHQVRDVMSKCLLARRRIAAATGRDAEIHVIQRRGPTAASREIARLLGFPVVATDAKVEGLVVHVPGLQPEGLFPEIFDFAVGDCAAGAPEKIYIARRGSRYVENDAEVTALLEARGFIKYYFEDMPILAQWMAVACARQVVAVHGAALAAAVFNRRGRGRPPGDPGGFRLVELFGAGYVVDGYRITAAPLNAHWCGVRGRITPEVVRDLDGKGLPRSHQSSPFRIDPGTLEMALDCWPEPP